MIKQPIKGIEKMVLNKKQSKHLNELLKKINNNNQ